MPTTTRDGDAVRITVGQGDRVRGRATLLAGALVALLVPAPAAGQVPPAVGTVRDALQDAERSLAEVESQLLRAREGVDALESRLDRASADLRLVEDDLAAAAAVMTRAQAAERAAARDLADAIGEMDDRLEEWEATREAVNARAAETYKHGAASNANLLFEGVTRSADLHDAAVAVRTVHGIMERDRELLRRNLELTRAANDARAAVSGLRSSARSEQRAAFREQRRVEQLVERQARLVAGIEADLAARAALVASIEADRVASAVLVEQLRRTISRMSVSIEDVLVSSADIPLDGPPPAWAAALPARGREWAPAIDAVATRVGIDGRLLAALIWTESNFTPTAVSHAGAVGMAQLMPGTARGLGVDPWDPVANMVGGARYLRTQMLRFGSVELGLAAYNAGPGRVQAAGGIPEITETQMYVLRVLERYERLRAVG